VPPPQRDVKLTEIREESGSFILGYVGIENTPWTYAVIAESAARSKLLHLFLNDLGVIYLTVVLMIAGIVVNLRISSTVVKWIEDAERNREEAIAESVHTGKLASIGRLAAGVAHEINNPLAVINEKAGLMKDLLLLAGEIPNRDKYLGIIKGISDSVSRCRAITHRLLGFARRMEINQEEIDVNSVISEVSEFLDKEMLYRSIRLELQLGGELPKLNSDRGQLQQVLLNIINNAIDAVADGGLITITTMLSGMDRVRISVRDTGQGIPRDSLKHIFEPFFTTKKAGNGTGLGLSISYGIIQRLGGTISVESEVGKGTCFTIEIPIHTPSD
jgi:two-component system NtrC family sensor kinase